jgi:hypothetical protein
MYKRRNYLFVSTASYLTSRLITRSAQVDGVYAIRFPEVSALRKGSNTSGKICRPSVLTKLINIPFVVPQVSRVVHLLN